MCKRDIQHNQLGASFIEVLAGMSLLSILIAISTVSFSDMLSVFSTGQATTQIEADIRKAKHFATAYNSDVFITSYGDHYSIGIDYFPYDQVVDEVVSVSKLPNSYTFESDKSIKFNSQGHLIDDNYDITTVVLTIRRNGNIEKVGSISGLENAVDFD